MVARQRAADRGTARGRDLLRVIGNEIRLARSRLSLSIRVVAREAGISVAELSRIERARAEWVSVIVLARLCAIVGLDLTARAYPGGRPIRDARHAELLARLKARLHPSLGWSTEAPMPNPSDQRAWDALIRGAGWRFGVECELNPVDGQALLRRMTLKQRDGAADGLILLVPDTRNAREFRRQFGPMLEADFPVPPRLALVRLSAGDGPGGNSVLVL